MENQDQQILACTDSLVIIFILYLYILKIFRKLVIVFFPVENSPKLINQQLKNGVKIVNWQKLVSYCFFLLSKIPLPKT